MSATAGFIQLGCTDDNNRLIIFSWFAINQSLRAGGFIAADHTDGMELIHALGFRQDQRHGAKWFSAKVHVQTGDDDADLAQPDQRGRGQRP